MTLNYDNTASAEANFVENELVSVLASAAVWPQEGAFYAKDFYLEGISSKSLSRRELVEGRDFVFSPKFTEESLETKKNIYSYAVVLDHRDWTGIRLTYRGLGLEDTALKSLIDNSTFDRLDVVKWLALNVPEEREEGARPLPSGGGFLEVLAGRLTTIARMVRGNGQVELDEAVLRNKLSNNTQDLLLGGLVSSNSRQNLDIAELIRLNTFSDEILDALAARNVAQNVLISQNTQSSILRTSPVDSLLEKNEKQKAALSDNIMQNEAVSRSLDETESGLVVGEAKLDAVVTLLNSVALEFVPILNGLNLIITNLENASVSLTGILGSVSSTVNDLIVKTEQNSTGKSVVTDKTTMTNANLDELESEESILNTRNLAQDLLIQKNEEALNALSQLIFGVDLTAINGAIALNTSKVTTNEDNLVGLKTKETEQGELINRLKLAVVTVKASVVYLGTEAILAAIAVVDDKLLDLGLEIEENQDRDDEQDARLQGIRDVISALGDASGVDLTSYQNQIDSNAIDIMPKAGEINAVTEINTEQDLTIDGNRARIDVLKNGAGDFDTADIESRITGQDDSRRSGLDSEDLVRDKNVSQNTRLDLLEATAVVVSDAGIPADINGYQTRIDAVTDSLPVASSQIEAVSPNQPAQTSLSITETAEIAVIAGGTDGITIDTSQVEIDITVNESTLADVEAVEVVQTSTIESQDARLEAIRVHDVEQDELIEELKGLIYQSAYLIEPADKSIVSEDIVLLRSSPYVPIVEGDEHVATEWDIRNEFDIENTAFYWLSEGPELEAIPEPGDLMNGGWYIARVRHISSISGTPPWLCSTTFKVPPDIKFPPPPPGGGGLSDVRDIAVDYEGRYVVVSMLGDESRTQGSGLVYEYDREAKTLTEVATLSPPSKSDLPSKPERHWFGLGRSIAMSEDGGTIAMGGSSYYEEIFNEESGRWDRKHDSGFVITYAGVGSWSFAGSDFADYPWMHFGKALAWTGGLVKVYGRDRRVVGGGVDYTNINIADIGNRLAAGGGWVIASGSSSTVFKNGGLTTQSHIASSLANTPCALSGDGRTLAVIFNQGNARILDWSDDVGDWVNARGYKGEFAVDYSSSETNGLIALNGDGSLLFVAGPGGIAVAEI